MIELKRAANISRIVIQNRHFKDDQSRARRLSVWISTDKARRGKLVWEAKDALSEWTINIKPAVRGQYVTIGLPDDVTNYLVLAGVQIFEQ
jgi:hypothetical protein